MRFTRTPMAAAVALATVAAGALALPAASADTADVTVDWRITQDWGSGFQGAVTITNSTGRAIDPWSVTVPYGNTISSAWDAMVTSVDAGYRITGPTWNTALPAGGSLTFGFIGQSRGSALVPSSCSIPSGACTVVGAPAGGSGTPTATPTPTASPTATSDATPTPSATVAPSTAADITVGVTVTSDWGTGRNVDITVTNSGSQAINSWTVSMPWLGGSVSMWNATGGVANGQLTATNASWNGALSPGATARLGLTDNGIFAAPQTCASSAGSCTIADSGQASTSTPTASPSATSTATPTATPTAPYTPQPGGYTGSRKLIAYYPSWATYARNYQVADIPAHKVTHINYAFANIANGRCVVGDSYADTDKAFAGDSWDQGAKRGNFNQLTKLRERNPNLKTMISIGGWTWSQNFPAAAASDQARKEFASSCIDFMKQYGFDGIDIDWEYPVSGGLYPGTPADRTNYTALLQEFRTQLDAREATDGTDYYLSIAAPAGPTTIPNLEAAKIGGILDWMNLMSYDFHGGWDPITGHNAPMTVGAKDRSARFSIADAVDAYLDSGFPASKLVLGVAFYGRAWEGVGSTDAGLYQPGTNASVGTWEKGVMDYSDIRANYLPTMTRYWDAAAKVPFLYDPARRLWISYDDPESMKVKTDYISARGLGGAMIWEISGDRSSELLDTLVQNLS